jgi:pimeloyl-ACP methyl ester carboxylesterase
MTLSSYAAREARLYSVAAGAGPEVLCLHSSGSSSSQWRQLIESAQAEFRVVAVDFLGHGRSPGQPAHFDLACESVHVWDTLSSSREPVHLVGHSYGGAVAIDLALRRAERIASLTVYEPVLFPLLDPGSAEYAEITSVGGGIVKNARAGDLEAATAAFIDYWNGPGSWRALEAEQQQRAQARIEPVAAHFEALFGSALTLERLHALHVPTLVLRGDRSPAAARAVCERLATLACVTVQTFTGLGHMGPMSHAGTVNAAIVGHLRAQSSMQNAA